MRTVWLGLLLGCSLAAASTIEVVRLYQPLSLHGTDGSGDEDAAGEALQAAVMERPYAIGGAVPEDLVKAVSKPCEIDTNAPGYEVLEANLLILCGITLEVRFNDVQTLVVTLDLEELKIPEEIDLTARQVLVLAIRAIRQTLERYYSEGEETLKWKTVITGTREGNESLKDLGKDFEIGTKKPDAAAEEDQ